MSSAIEASGIEKSFIKRRSIYAAIAHPFRRAERVQALRGVDLDVRRGEIFGLLGPNGAGKTTLLKILSCLVLPDRGRVQVGGIDTYREKRVKRQIGLVNSDERSFYWRLSARENLRFFARLYNLSGHEIDRTIDRLLERVDMVEAADLPFSGYSSGMKQRIAIARAMLHDPPILLMDEPTRSLDPAASLALRTFIGDELNRRAGKTIVLATHNLREAEALSHRVAILVKGQVRQLGSVEDVRRWGLETNRFRLQTDALEAPVQGPFQVIAEEVLDGRRRTILSLDAGATYADLMRTILGSGVTVHACDRVESDLEEAFARIMDSDETPR